MYVGHAINPENKGVFLMTPTRAIFTLKNDASSGVPYCVRGKKEVDKIKNV